MEPNSTDHRTQPRSADTASLEHAGLAVPMLEGRGIDRNAPSSTNSDTHEKSHQSIQQGPPLMQNGSGGNSLWTKCRMKWQRVYDYLQDSWIMEIAACTLAAILFGAEVVTLFFFDGKGVDRWPSLWSLNSAVAFITTVIESLLFFAIASAIGQMKWLWFLSSKNKLIWIDLLARSSTPVGALSILLLHTKTWRNFIHMPVWLGASCVLALLGTALFSQNVIAQKLVTEAYVSDGTYVSISQGYEAWSLGLSGSALGDQGPSSNMVSYGTAGLAYASNLIQYTSSKLDDVSLNGLNRCDYDRSPNCSYGLHSTLNICARCVDVSDDINMVSGKFVLRSGILSLDVERGHLNITSDTRYPDQGRFNTSEIGPLIVHYLALGHDPDAPHKAPVATECVAYWCVTTFDARYVSNHYYVRSGMAKSAWSESKLDLNIDSTSNYSLSGRTTLGQGQAIYIQTDSCYINNTNIVDTEQCTFRVLPEAQLGLQNFLSEGYFGMPPLLSGSVERTSTPDAWRSTTFAALAIASACNDDDNETECTKHLNASISDSFTNMTAFMSNVVRKTPAWGLRYSYGTTYQIRHVFDIRWPWIAYPATVVLTVCAFVATTIHQSRKTQPWKASILPALFHSIRDIDQDQLTDLAAPAAMRKKAEELSAELQELEGTKGKAGRMQWRVVV